MVIVPPVLTVAERGVSRDVWMIPIASTLRPATTANVIQLVPRMQRVSQDISAFQGFAPAVVGIAGSVLGG